MENVVHVPLRRYRGVADLDGMAALRNARIKREGEGEFATVESMAEHYTHLQRCDAETDIAIADDGGTIVAYARTTWDDGAAIWEADRDANRDHFGYVEPTDADWAMFLDSTAERGTALWQVAWAGDEVIGQVRTYANEGDEQLWGRKRAWTEEISTRRDWRGRGVASAVICASLRQLGELGFDEAALGVDTQNPTGAFKLYESLGYRVVATEVQYQREIVA